MPRRVAPDETIYLDEAEGFLLEHALFSPTRSWRPAPPEKSQTERLTANKRKMDWEGEVRAHPDEPIVIPQHKKDGDDDANSERCVICLMALRDRTIVGVCGHEFCFECIGVWANQSRRCPLCSTEMSAFLLHDLDNTTPTKFYLPPLPQRKLPSMSLPGPSRRMPLPEERQRMEEEMQEKDELDLQVEKRREIYDNELYVKHIASNPTTKFRPNPTPRQISESAELIQRATAFMRRELRVWSLVDVEFLTTYILSLLKAIDIRSEPAIRLLAEFLETPNGPGYPHAAEHFAHELYSFLRSPYKDLRKYDEVVQYDPVPQPRSRSPSRSRSRSRSVSSRSLSRSPLSPISQSQSPIPRSPPRAQPNLPPRPRSPRPGRDSHERNSFRPPRSPTRKRWNEHDTWLDPDYAAWLEEERRRDEERRAWRRERRRRSTAVYEEDTRPMRAWADEPRVRGLSPEPISRSMELLPSPPPPPLRMDNGESTAIAQGESSTTPGLSIKGAAHGGASTGARKRLLERLVAAKAEAAAKTNGSASPDVAKVEEGSAGDSAAPAINGVRAAVQARLRLKLKLASEKKAYVFNQNESRAQALRAQILEAKARRQASEEDAVLREMDRLDRAREIRRRLMVEKMKAAETESERRARELKEQLMGERKAKILREKLKEKMMSKANATAGTAVAVS